MRICDILSSTNLDEFKQCDPFLGDRNVKIGKQKKINDGKVFINYHCNKCNNDYTFTSIGELMCLRVGERMLSIDTVLKCPSCDVKLPIWFLIESEHDIDNHTYNRYRVLKRVEKFNDNVSMVASDHGNFTELLIKADIANNNQLGAAAIVYLRKVFEGITHQVAQAQNINIYRKNGSLNPFKEILEEVDARSHIIPIEFSQNGYRLFRELSDIVHGDSVENDALGLVKYKALKCLVVGILDNVKRNSGIMEAIGMLGWNNEGEADE